MSYDHSLQSPHDPFFRPHLVSHPVHLAIDSAHAPHPRPTIRHLLVPPTLRLWTFLPALLCLLASGLRWRARLGLEETEREEVDRQETLQIRMAGQGRSGLGGLVA